MESYLRVALELEDGSPITASDLERLERLELNAENTVDFQQIEDLSGLEHAVNLDYIHLGYTAVTDLTPLQGLQNVTYFRINNTGITDISPLEDYTALTYFNANSAEPGISDLSPLAGNLGLQEIIVRNNPLGNEGLQVLANFTGLYRLNVRNTGITDVSVIGDLMAAGAFLVTTPGAEEAGEDAVIDLRENEIESWDPVLPYINDGTAVAIDGGPEDE